MLTKILNFLSLLDSENRLSITNITVFIVVGKLIFIPEPSLAEIGAFLVAMLNYSHKRYTSNSNNNDENSQKEDKNE